MYGIEDPLKTLERPPTSKLSYKKSIMAKITSYHEKELRKLSENNEAMKYLNVSVLGLSGRPHPAITGVTTSHEVKKMRPHIKMLSGNYITFEI